MSLSPVRIEVLRLGYRPGRDPRVNTHLCLTARALGASTIYLTGRDDELERSVAGVVSSFGGCFSVEVCKSWRSVIRDFPGVTVHLSMYGDRLNQSMEAIMEGARRSGAVLVVVGGEKVPREIYEMVDFNLAVGNQPHSEIAALAIFLDRLQQGRELERDFQGEIHIEPYCDGKKQVHVRK